MAATTSTSFPTPPARSTSISNVSYEKFAPRSTEQVSRLSRLAALTAGPTAQANEDSASSDNDRPDFYMKAMAPRLSNDADSTDRLATLQEDTPVHQTLQKATKTCDQLTTQLKHTTSLRLALRACINIAEDVSNRHAELIRHSGELSAAADRLQEEEAMLTRHAQEIGMPLKHYDAVDRIGVLVGVLFIKGKSVRGLAKIKVDDDDFLPLLDEIDDAVDFFGKETGGKQVLEAELKRHGDKPLNSGSMEYYRRALALQDAALYLIREAVAERISQTTTQVTEILKLTTTPVPADQLEASLIYTRFHGISSRSNRLLSIVRSRLGRGDAYHELLQQCRSTYCSSRESLLRLTIRAHMDKLKEQHGPVGMTRLASVFLIRLCTVETALYVDFFGDKKEIEDVKSGESKRSEDASFYDSEFQNYLTALCGALHRTVRHSLVRMTDLDTLCQIVSVLREERSMASSSPTTMAAARAISTVISDAQERLIFCADSTLQKEVIRFKATPKDLDYPDKLIKKEAASDTSEDDDDAVEKQLQQVYESWFPPIRSVLRILSKIFRVVEPRVFEDMALSSVQACTKCLKDGSNYIKQRKGVMHSDLFLVKHLLILREQLSPFDIELRSVERQLDFSDAGKAVARFLANRNRRLFSMSTENALITLLREGVSVQESSVDSKRDLENALKSACNDFIEHAAKTIAEDLLQMVEQCRVADVGSLAQHALLNFDAVEGLVNKSREDVDKALQEVSAQLKLYLENPGTQSILLKPVSRKIVKSIEELRKFISSVPDGELDWDAEKRARVNETLDVIEQSVKKATKATK